MSSPISSLKKNKRSPLHSPSKSTGDKVSAPFRHPDFSEDQLQFLTENTPTVRFLKGLKPFRRSDDAVNLLESLTANRGGQQQTFTRTKHSALSTNNQELTCLLMSRLVQVETKLAEAQKLLFEKDEKISFLEEKLKICEKTKESADASQSVKELQEQCLKFQQQIQEMEKFLNDYGMVWVGERKTSTVSVSITDASGSDITEERVKVEPMWKPETSTVANTDREFKIDFDLVKENIKELNIIAGDGISQVDITANGGQLKTVEPIPLTLYANGFVMFNGPFRSFSETSTQQYMQDLMDGYYPSELQSIYPEGVPFLLTDKRTVVYKPCQLPFQGEGMTLTGKKKSNLSLDSQSLEEIKMGYQLSEEYNLKRMMKKIPSIIIKDGKIVSVYNSKNKTKEYDVKKLITVPTTNSHNGIREIKSKNCICLRLKSETGNESYLIKMSTMNTVGDLRKALDNFRLCHTTPYKIISLYPHKVFGDDTATLEECGLTQNMVLFLRPCS